MWAAEMVVGVLAQSWWKDRMHTNLQACELRRRREEGGCIGRGAELVVTGSAHG